jgi:signal transduction histidine kinase
VLHNLLQNALKFTLRGSTKVIISYDDQSMNLQGKVIDSGIGISPQKITSLFKLRIAPHKNENEHHDDFAASDHAKISRLNSDRENFGGQRTSGIGLGLYICRKLCQEYRGEITCESEVDCGTTITFTMRMPLPYNTHGSLRHYAASSVEVRLLQPRP